MKLDMLASLKEQAERLLMVKPGQYNFSPINFCRDQILEVYQQNVRHPPKNDDGHQARYMVLLLNWIAAYEWWSILGPRDNPMASDYGIFLVSGTERHRTIQVYCYDFTHYDSMPAVVNYNGSRFGRTFWTANTHRATYRNDAPIALGIC